MSLGRSPLLHSTEEDTMKTIYAEGGYWEDGRVWVEDRRGGALGEPLPRARRELQPYLSEVNHSPTGYAWGYGGSGPAQLAYAMLREVGLTPDEAQRWYQGFKFSVIGALDQKEGFSLTEPEILEKLKDVQTRHRAAE
jgi:hypothetical protein